MSEKDTFAFEKKLFIHLTGERAQDFNSILRAFSALYQCMLDTNKQHDLTCEFFRLDFRQASYDEMLNFPINSYILDFKCGSKKEFEEKKENK